MDIEKQNKNKWNQEEFGLDLSPDDLDIREENELSKEQLKNSHKEKNKEKNSRHEK
ncbi:hypothetical protein [Lysinibacillus sp. 54212]|uniref:hypothetical protein n=1 Tax=Lysinibacillus sp. 54212 TaxID=3119829 RepID=UPI002FC6F777